jgi:hypothetical protein
MGKCQRIGNDIKPIRTVLDRLERGSNILCSPDFEGCHIEAERAGPLRTKIQPRRMRPIKSTMSEVLAARPSACDSAECKLFPLRGVITSCLFCYSRAQLIKAATWVLPRSTSGLNEINSSIKSLALRDRAASEKRPQPPKC